MRVRQNWPSTLHQALEVSLELESFYLTNKQRSHKIREEILEDEELDQNAIRQISEVVRWTMKETRQTRTQAGLHSQRHQRTVTCWHCGKKDHVQRECPVKAKSAITSSQSGNG